MNTLLRLERSDRCYAFFVMTVTRETSVPAIITDGPAGRESNLERDTPSSADVAPTTADLRAWPARLPVTFLAAAAGIATVSG